jgi:ABC-type phosphate transport system substrate-binding protein
MLVLSGIVAHTQNLSLTVISNQKGAPTEMKQSELKSIFLGEKQRWRNGNKIVIALMKTNTAAGKYVCEKIYDMSGDELKKHWLALVFQGKAEAPAFFNTVSELQAFVSENPGAIGIIDQTPSASGTQVVLIDGRRSF